MEQIPEFLILPAAKPAPSHTLGNRKGGLARGVGGMWSSQKPGPGPGAVSVPAILCTPVGYLLLLCKASEGREIRVIKIRPRIFKLEAKKRLFFQ